MPSPEPPPDNFVQILERVWWRLDRALDATSLRAAARLYIAEALLAGTCTLFDHHESPCWIEGSLDVLAAACRELKIRALLCYGASERNEGREEARRGLAECARFIRSLPEDDPLMRGAVALHASFTVSDETLREAGDLARELGGVVHVHLAEDAADVRDAVARGYRGVLDRLLELRALPRGSILAHGVHLSAPEVQRAAAAGLWLVQNPRSNRGNDVGYPTHLSESSAVALGTDGYPADMDVEFAALRAEATAARLHEREADLLGRLHGGFRLANELFHTRLGQLPAAGGAPVSADLRVLDERGVRHVIVAGALVVHEGELLTGDISEIREQARAAAPLLWSRMRAL
jgi:cytosine/adenosine deaminase-related metal-dependent hydrolase